MQPVNRSISPMAGRVAALSSARAPIRFESPPRPLATPVGMTRAAPRRTESGRFGRSSPGPADTDVYDPEGHAEERGEQARAAGELLGQVVRFAAY